MLLEFQSVKEIFGPIIYVEGVDKAAYNEVVEITMPSGEKVKGQVLETSKGMAAVQVFGNTTGLDTKQTRVRFTGETLKLPVGEHLLGRTLNGRGEPIDGLGSIATSGEKRDINGSAINPYSRAELTSFIQTGISTIDCTNTLVRGQKLPLFSASGLPHNDLAAQIARQATVRSADADQGDFVVVFAAMGVTNSEAAFFMRDLERTGALKRSVLFINLASDPSIERLITPRLALTTAEYLAFECDMHVLVILTDMTNYCDSLREIAAARQEVPGRRGYPGYMYTDLASLYERAGAIKGKKGSVTQLPILSMPDEDITHPIPDLTGYITEGQIVLSRELYRKNVLPCINILPSLSRLMGLGIGTGKTREDHSGVFSQIYAAYAEGLDLRNLVAVVGEEALTPRDRKYLQFAEAFEKKFVTQGREENRTIENSLDLAWELLATLPETELKRVKPEHLEKYGRKYRQDKK